MREIPPKMCICAVEKSTSAPTLNINQLNAALEIVFFSQIILQWLRLVFSRVFLFWWKSRQISDFHLSSRPLTEEMRLF